MSDRYLNAGADFPRLLSHEYKPICVWCGKPLPSATRKYCSRECYDEVGLRCGFGIRWKLYERDKGICSRCGRDCEEVQRAITTLSRFNHQARAIVDTSSLAKVLRLTYWEMRKSLWEAHHKKAVKDGGGACGLDNFETVCIWCHKKETATQAADAAHVRRVERQDQLPLLQKRG